MTPSSVSRSISSSGALLTVAALVPSEYVIGTSTADVLASLIVSCGRRAALRVAAIIGAPFRRAHITNDNDSSCPAQKPKTTLSSTGFIPGPVSGLPPQPPNAPYGAA